MRGCFYVVHLSANQVAAFPAYAGMFLGTLKSIERSMGFPRVCGDVSRCYQSPYDRHQLSPRMRGCFLLKNDPLIQALAFPAYAGMFPAEPELSKTLTSFPRVCGDVSDKTQQLCRRNELSPRMRGCFFIQDNPPVERVAFPAYAGMFLETKVSAKS